MEDVLNIPGSIHSISQEGNAVYANEVFDKRKNKKQQLVNQETDEELDNHGQRIGTLEEAVGEGGSVDERIAQAKSEAESDIKGGASEDYDTLKKAEEAIKAEVNAREGAVSDEASARQDAINTAKTEIIGGASTDCNTLGKAEIKISTNAQDIAQLQAAYEALTQSTPVIVEPTDTWPVANPQQNIIYRVVDRVNTPPQYYEDYMYNGTAMVLMARYNNAIDPRPKKGSQNLVSSGGVFDNMGALDVSELNATENPHTLATYADLSAALATIPSDYQKGGMSIKFVQSSDNKYVQYRLMADEFSTTPSDWQGVDELVAGSNDLVKSKDIYNGIVTHETGLIGDGQNPVWSEEIKVIPNHTYCLSLSNPNIAMSEISRGYILGISATKGNFNTALIAVPLSDGFKPSYAFTIPSNVNNIYVGCRCNDGLKFGFSIVDTLDNLPRMEISGQHNFKYSIIGKGNNLVKYGEAIDVLPNTNYILHIYSLEKTGIPQTSNVFLVYKEDGITVLFNLPASETLKNRYEFSVPADTNKIIFAGRADAESSIIFSIETSICTVLPFTNNDKLNLVIKDLNVAPSFIDLNGNDYSFVVLRGDLSDGQYRNGIVIRKTNVASDLVQLYQYFDTLEEALSDNNRIFEDDNIRCVLSDNFKTESYSGVGFYPLSISEYNKNVINIIGNGNTLVKKKIRVERGHRYSFILNSLDYQRTELTGYYLRIYGELDGGEIDYAQATNNDSLCLINNFYINDDIDFVYVCVKADNTERVKGIVYDTTDTMNNTVVIAFSNSSDSDKCKADVILKGNSTVVLNTIQGFVTAGFNIKFLEGYAYIVSYISLTKDSQTIEGVGNVQLLRVSNGYVLKDGSAIHGVTISNISTNQTIDLLTNSGSYNITLNNVTDTNGYIKHVNFKSSNSHIITVGDGCDFENFEEAYAFALSNISKLKYNSNTIELHIYGHIKMTRNEQFIVVSRGISFIGKTEDATLEIECTSAINGFDFVDTNYYGIIHAEYKNIRFLISGSYGSWQRAAALIEASDLLFENCTFENTTSYSASYNPESDDNTLRDGDRKHGCLIQINKYGDDCKTIFRNCIGKGSPYGFKNCRGFYILNGSPKLYNCIGYGGGIGRRGYGIICHGSSKAYLENCIGYGSQYGWGLCNGIQFQAASQSTLVNCIGYGGTGYQYISNGDTDIIKQSTISEASHGFGFLMDVSPNIINCIGYAGDGNGSSAIFTDNVARPNIIGGYYGKEILMYASPFTPDDEQTYMTLTTLGNDNRNIELVGIYLRDLSGTNVENINKFTFKVGNDVIAESTSKSTEIWMPIINADIDSNEIVTCHVEDANGDDISQGVSFKIYIRYKVSNSMELITMTGNSLPSISKCIFEGNSQCDGVSVNTNSNEYKISDCEIRTSALKYAVKSSSEKTNVRIIDCLFSSQLLLNILSFVTPTSIGTNKVL